MTAYRAVIYQGRVGPESTVLVTGIGGGVAQLACQIASAAGAKVYVTSGDEEKIERAKKLGAIGGANYHKEDWHKEFTSKRIFFDVIIDG